MNHPLPAADSLVLRRGSRSDAPGTLDHLLFFCPGCKLVHPVFVGDGPGPRWGWNGDMDRPTFTPSLLCRYPWGEERKPMVCHSFISQGVIDFLGDCTHALAGHEVPIPAFTWDDEVAAP